MITQPNEQISKQPNQPPIILSDKQKRIQKCQQITKKIQSKITDQLQNGQIKLRSKPLHIQLNDQFQTIKQNPQRSIRDKISSLNCDLQMLQKHIALQKEQDKIKQQHKKRQAAMLIERLKKQKQEYRNKMKLNQMNFRLKNSVLSQDVIKLMKERRESLIHQKKSDMELRIYKNLNRKIQREDDQAKNQIDYWSKIKQIQGKKRNHSTKVLPSIHKINQQPQFGINMDFIQRKNSNKNLNFAHKRSFSRQDISQGYLQIVNKFIERAKAKQYESKSQKIQNNNIKSRIVTNQVGSEKGQSLLANSLLAVGLIKNEKIEQIHALHFGNKQKLLGDQYLKQSLLRVRSKSPRAFTLEDNNSFIEQSLQMKGNQAIFSRNDKICNLQGRREKILQNLLVLKIDKARAIQMLSPVQSKLDKINPEGIEQRLAHKLKLFQQLKKKQKQYQNQNEQYPKKSANQQKI